MSEQLGEKRKRIQESSKPKNEKKKVKEQKKEDISSPPHSSRIPSFPSAFTDVKKSAQQGSKLSFQVLFLLF